MMMWLVSLMLCLGCGRLNAQRSSSNLETLVNQAGMIFAGKVIDVETGTKDRMNLYMTAYTFEVLDPVYGVDGDTITVKQYGGEANGKHFYPKGIPRFDVGEEVVVFLYPLSYIGMTSAVGRDQGKFWIRGTDSLGTRVVVNNRGNKGLFHRLRHPDLLADQAWLDEDPAPLPYKPFMKTVKNLVEKLKEEQRQSR